MMSRNGVLLLAFLTIVIFGGGGLAVIYFFHSDSYDQIFFPKADVYSPLQSVFFQAATGISYGLVSAVFLWWIVKRDFMKDTREFFTNLIGGLGLKGYDIVIISFCAGVGEELFFRGAIQPWLGIWITSIVFVAIHGYLSPSNKPLTVYGLCMVLVIAGMGYLARYAGLFSAMIAHTIIDIYLFAKLRQNVRYTSEVPENED
jgi:membrane protease YdiL (CAAX protease family)